MKAPKCKTCGEEHWGTCANHGAKGALSGAANVVVVADAIAQQMKRDALAAAVERVSKMSPEEVAAAHREHKRGVRTAKAASKKVRHGKT